MWIFVVWLEEANRHRILVLGSHLARLGALIFVDLWFVLVVVNLLRDLHLVSVATDSR